jgi:hypothetical protein
MIWYRVQIPAPVQSVTDFTYRLFEGAFSIIVLPPHFQSQLRDLRYRLWDSIAFRIAWSAMYLLSERPVGPHQWGVLVYNIERDEAAMKQWFELNATFSFQGRTLKEWVRMSKYGMAWVRCHNFLCDSLFVVMGFFLFLPLGNELIDSMELWRFALSMVSLLFSCGIYHWSSMSLVFCTLLVLFYEPLMSPWKLLRYFLQSLALEWMLFGTRNPKSTVTMLQKEIKMDILATIQQSLRLVVADKEFIGIACSNVQNRDKIYFIDSCKRPLILREVETSGRLQFKVVRKIQIYLSARDRRKYHGFVDDLNDERREECFQWYKRNGMFETLELV